MFRHSRLGSFLLIPVICTSVSGWCSDVNAIVEVLSRPELFREQGPIQSQAEELVSAYAPKYWFHSEDPGPSDPIQFLADSSLWLRAPGAVDLKIVERGKLDPAELPRLWKHPGPARPSDSLNGSGLFLKRESLSISRSPAASDWRGVPMLWRFGSRVRDDLFLIEYWFHADFSRGGPIGIGNHQGDWEGVAALVGARVPQPGVLLHRLVAMYFAAHEGGSWECAQDLEWVSDETGRRRPEAFSALGTHATYPKPGRNWNPLFLEDARRGKAWDTWKSLRPLALEPYFGFSGAWGEANNWAFMSGPMPPGSFKTMPREKFRESWVKVIEPMCASKPTWSSLTWEQIPSPPELPMSGGLAADRPVLPGEPARLP